MIKFKESSLLKLDDYLNLYNKIFQTNKKKTYYDWLYSQNPLGNFVGIDCYDDNKLIGQVGGIPQEYLFCGDKKNFILSINVCVDPNYQGKGLFNNMACKLEEIAKIKNFDGIIAIANKAATPAWKKSIEMNFLKQLDVYIGYGSINYQNFEKKNYKFYSNWNYERLKWRCNNPLSETLIVNNSHNQKSIYCKTNYPFIDVYSPFIFNDYENDIVKSTRNILKPKIFIGDAKYLNKKFFIKFPEILKPSPLNFLYKFIQTNKMLKSEEVFFSFLDFDAF